jgi:hypothetical protein
MSIRNRIGMRARNNASNSSIVAVVLLGIVFFIGAFGSIAAQSSTPWRTAQGRACINAWMRMTVSRLNATDLGQNYNSRKPWRFNRYGLLLGKGSFSNSAPDLFSRYENVQHWVWAHYNQNQYAGWTGSLAFLGRANIPSVKSYTRSCEAGSGGGGPGPSPGAGGGFKSMLHKHSRRYVCTGATQNGGNIHIWGPVPRGHEARYQFKLIPTRDGYYYILHRFSGKYVCSGSRANGGNIFHWGPIPRGHEDRYKFKLIPTRDGYYYIQHKFSGKYVCSGSQANGGNIHLWGPIPRGHEARYKFSIR